MYFLFRARQSLALCLFLSSLSIFAGACPWSRLFFGSTFSRGEPANPSSLESPRGEPANPSSLESRLVFFFGISICGGFEAAVMSLPKLRIADASYLEERFDFGSSARIFEGGGEAAVGDCNVLILDISYFQPRPDFFFRSLLRHMRSGGGRLIIVIDKLQRLAIAIC